jgi:translation initiation factor 3 subunit E
VFFGTKTKDEDF